MTLPVDSSQLTTPTTSIGRVKYFPIELSCSNMLPNTVYDLFLDGISINAFCKPFGANLGDPVTSDSNGKVKVQYMFAIPFNQSYLANQTLDNGLVSTNKTLTLRDPYGNESVTYIPILMKAAS